MNDKATNGKRNVISMVNLDH